MRKPASDIILFVAHECIAQLMMVMLLLHVCSSGTLDEPIMHSARIMMCKDREKSAFALWSQLRGLTFDIFSK